MSDNGIEITGGTHGVVAQTEEMQDRAAALRAAADALADAAAVASALRRRVARGVLANGGSIVGRAAADALEALGAVRGLGATSDELARTADAVAAAAEQYLEAETAARGGLARAAQGRGTALGEHLLPWAFALPFVRASLSPPFLVGAAAGMWVAGRLGLLPVGQQAEPLVAGVAGFFAAAPFGRNPDGDPVAIVAGRLATVGGRWRPESADLTDPTPELQVVPVGVQDGADPVTDAASALRLVASQRPEDGAQPGQVAIQRLDHADGTRSWVVAIPGTQLREDVYSLNSDFVLAAGGASGAVALVAQAMRQAGIAPGEPVALAGHSQGGMIAARIAADPVLQRRFTMRALVTAGSPIAPVDLPGSVQTLSLEHRQDYVPTADGMPNPDTLSRITVEADAPGSPHALEGYITTAEGLPTDDGSLADFQAELSDVLGDDVVSATTLEFQGVMADDPGALSEGTVLASPFRTATVAPLPREAAPWLPAPGIGLAPGGVVGDWWRSAARLGQ